MEVEASEGNLSVFFINQNVNISPLPYRFITSYNKYDLAHKKLKLLSFFGLKIVPYSAVP